jgi:hypothetical protein
VIPLSVIRTWTVVLNFFAMPLSVSPDWTRYVAPETEGLGVGVAFGVAVGVAAALGVAVGATDGDEVAAGVAEAPAVEDELALATADAVAPGVGDGLPSPGATIRLKT